MMKRWEKVKWYILWILLSVNVVLLSIALLNDGPWYMLFSLLWSLGILMYHGRITKANNNPGDLTPDRRRKDAK